MAKYLAPLLALLTLVGCGPPPTSPPTPTMVPEVTVGLSAVPLAVGVGEVYREQEGPLPFDLVPTGSQAGLELAADEEVLFHLDYPPVPDGWRAYTIGWEGLAVAVHPSVPLRTLTLEDLEEIFTGRADNWEELGAEEGAIQVVVPPEGDRLRGYFVDRVLPNGHVTTRARLAPAPADTVELVAAIEGAIGLLPLYARPQEGVALVRVEGVLPGASTVKDGSYPLRVPLLALTPEPPNGVAARWLSWVQSADLDLLQPTRVPTASLEPTPP